MTMSHLIAPDYGQPFLLPPALEAWVPAGHPVRFRREFVGPPALPALGGGGDDDSSVSTVPPTIVNPLPPPTIVPTPPPLYPPEGMWVGTTDTGRSVYGFVLNTTQYWVLYYSQKNFQVYQDPKMVWIFYLMENSSLLCR